MTSFSWIYPYLKIIMITLMSLEYLARLWNVVCLKILLWMFELVPRTYSLNQSIKSFLYLGTQRNNEWNNKAKDLNLGLTDMCETFNVNFICNNRFSSWNVLNNRKRHLNQKSSFDYIHLFQIIFLCHVN